MKKKIRNFFKTGVCLSLLFSGSFALGSENADSSGVNIREVQFKMIICREQMLENIESLDKESMIVMLFACSNILFDDKKNMCAFQLKYRHAQALLKTDSTIMRRVKDGWFNKHQKDKKIDQCVEEEKYNVSGSVDFHDRKLRSMAVCLNQVNFNSENAFRSESEMDELISCVIEVEQSPVLLEARYTALDESMMPERIMHTLQQLEQTFGKGSRAVNEFMEQLGDSIEEVCLTYNENGEVVNWCDSILNQWANEPEEDKGVSNPLSEDEGSFHQDPSGEENAGSDQELYKCPAPQEEYI